MATYVLIHGGGHGGWCWKWTAAELRARGHDVYSPTLTGFGERSHLAGSATSFQTFIDDIVAVLTFEDLSDVVLVGHSMGGTIVPRVAETAPGRISCAVWLTAAVCADGQTMLEAVTQSPWIGRAVTIDADGTARTDPDLILDAAIHDGTASQRSFVKERHRPYPPHALVEPGRLSSFLRLGIPTGYVFTSEDRTIEPDVQRKMCARLPGAGQATVVAGHDAMITRPLETAAAIESVTASAGWSSPSASR